MKRLLKTGEVPKGYTDREGLNLSLQEDNANVVVAINPQDGRIGIVNVDSGSYKLSVLDGHTIHSTFTLTTFLDATEAWNIRVYDSEEEFFSDIHDNYFGFGV